MFLRVVLLSVLLICAVIRVHADEWRIDELSLADGVDLGIERYGQGRDRLLWLPSEFGMHGEVERGLLEQIAAQGVEVALLDLHSSYFIAPGRSSYQSIDPADLVEVIGQNQPDEGRLFLLSAGRGAALLLQAARLWQLENAQATPLGGLILLHPNLAAGIAEAGEDMQYLTIADASNLPIYIFQPLNSAKRWYLGELVERLGRSGSDVFAHRLPGVSDGFQVRGDATGYEIKIRKLLPGMVAQAMRLLGHFNGDVRQAVAVLPDRHAPTEMKRFAGLQPMAGTPPASVLKLKGLDGNTVSLADYRGKVVLLNFWATWCPPCVKEIPSLNRLQQRLSGRPFAVVSVDVGEGAEQVAAFLKKVPAEYPVLLDIDGVTVPDWDLRAFPTSYVIDREGRLRYGYYGGLEWDADEVVGLIEGLL